MYGAQSSALLYRQSMHFLLITVLYMVLLCRLIFSQSIDQIEPLQKSVFVKHTNGWLINTLQQAASYCTITHRLIAMDKRVLHNAACYSFQEQSGAPPCVSLPNLRVSSWLMCNWLDEWLSHSVNPSKYCLIKRPRASWLKNQRDRLHLNTSTDPSCFKIWSRPLIISVQCGVINARRGWLSGVT